MYKQKEKNPRHCETMDMEMSVVRIYDDENTTHLSRQHNIPKKKKKKVFIQVVSSLHQSYVMSI